jgi:cell division protein FtsW (lipid II flippase)
MAYQLCQGVLGFASGGLWVNQVGNAKLQLIDFSEAHPDSILPISEGEFGSIAIICALALYHTFSITCIRTRTDARSNNICRIVP